MAGDKQDFGQTAVALSRTPLGVIALFIVLIYLLASVVTVLSSNKSGLDISPLVYFLSIFPVVVLAAFVWLVHTGKILAPAEFKSEENYLQYRRMLAPDLRAAAALIAAEAQKKSDSNEPDDESAEVDANLEGIVEAVARSSAARHAGNKQWSILWVDDNPKNNVYPRKAFESRGVAIELALSTDEAMQKFKVKKFDAIISDMGRKEGPREGYVLLEKVRSRDKTIPFFIYAGSNLPEHREMAIARGAQGSTNNSTELFRLVMDAILDDPR
ncbi:MAG TPA: response regulator [Parvularculaceae bacterium]|nr:response regulator [Parvularculaceae bacterium]